MLLIVIGYDLVSYLLHYPSARCVTFKELFVCKSSYFIRDFDINSRFFIPSFIRFFRKSGIVRRNTIAQNEFWTNVCRLPHSRRKGHCLTPKRCLDWWSNAPFFCAYVKRCFYGFSDDFSFFAVSFRRKRKVNAECVSLPHEWNRQSHTAGKPVRMTVAARWNKYHRIGNIHTSLSEVCPFHASGNVFFFFGFSFLWIFTWSFFYPICLCFRLPPFCAFQWAASVSHFRSGRKGNSGIGRESKVKPPVFGKNLQPCG